MKISKEFIQKINDRLDKKVLTYAGPVVNFDEIEIEIKFKLRIVGTKEMILVGTWTDYIVFDIDVLDILFIVTESKRLKRLSFGFNTIPTVVVENL